MAAATRWPTPVTGTMTRGWRLTAGEQLALGRVAQDGVPQLITTLPGSRRRGVEVRRGTLNLDARSRLEGALRSPPAVGWDQDFQGLSTTLHLPPGWRLFAASGMDDATATWLMLWTLLDLFLVLLAGIAIGHLWGPATGLLGLAALILIWQEACGPDHHLAAPVRGHRPRAGPARGVLVAAPWSGTRPYIWRSSHRGGICS
jgi:hypothetical protein